MILKAAAASQLYCAQGLFEASSFAVICKEYYVHCYQAIAASLSGVSLKNFKFIDLSGVFDRYGAEDDMFLDQFHFGDKGNAVIAQAILASLAPKIEYSMRKN